MHRKSIADTLRAEKKSKDDFSPFPGKRTPLLFAVSGYPPCREKEQRRLLPVSGKKNTFALRRVLYHIRGRRSREKSAFLLEFPQKFGLFLRQFPVGDVLLQEVRPPLLRDPQGFPPPVPADAPVVP